MYTILLFLNLIPLQRYMLTFISPLLKQINIGHVGLLFKPQQMETSNNTNSPTQETQHKINNLFLNISILTLMNIQ